MLMRGEAARYLMAILFDSATGLLASRLYEPPAEAPDYRSRHGS